MKELQIPALLYNVSPWFTCPNIPGETAADITSLEIVTEGFAEPEFLVKNLLFNLCK